MKNTKRLSALIFALLILSSSVALSSSAEGKSYKNYKGFVYNVGYESDDIAIINYKGDEKNIVIPNEIYGEDVEFIKLQKATKARSVVIPENAEFVRVSQAPNLIKVTVDRENEDFTAKNGIVFNKKGTVVYSVAGGRKNVKIPAKVKKVFHQAFVGSQVENVVIGKDVTYIDTYAFYRCKKLESVTVNSAENAPKIGVSAFEDTKGTISFYTKNKKVARQLKNRLKKSGLETYRIYSGKALVYKK